MILNDKERYGKFDAVVTTRLYDEEIRRIEDILKNKKDVFGTLKYENQSHFIRCAIIRLIQEEV